MWLWGLLARSGSLGTVRTGRDVVKWESLADSSSLEGRVEQMRGRSVLLATQRQLPAALALLELDGVARRVVLSPPALSAAYIPGIMRDAAIDACVWDVESRDAAIAVGVSEPDVSVAARGRLVPLGSTRFQSEDTEWVLLTSGTTGAPKLVVHTCKSLTNAFAGQPSSERAVVWSTFYDIRRYGGLQIFLRAVHSGSLVLSEASESAGEFLKRAGRDGVTHLSGTPSHWRRALMSGMASEIAPRYVRLSGEIADQPILESLKLAYPDSSIDHAFASTEAGVVFAVGDCLAGFPKELLNSTSADTEVRVVQGSLQVRGPGTAERYLGQGVAPLRRADGFVDTGDLLELHAGRYRFLGRAGGIINVGGLKVHPEEVEAIINEHPRVQMSLVKARRNPIVGAIVTAEVLPRKSFPDSHPVADDSVSFNATLVREILDLCRRRLAPHKVPATIRVVPALEISVSGKLVRSDA